MGDGFAGEVGSWRKEKARIGLRGREAIVGILGAAGAVETTDGSSAGTRGEGGHMLCERVN